MTVSTNQKASFSFLEIVIVVVILAALAGLVVPYVGRASEDPGLAPLAATLQTVRTQLQYYKMQHNDIFPSFDNWQEQMLRKTAPSGKISRKGSRGPYLLQIPANPLDGSRRISPVLDGQGGWTYDQDTGEFFSNDASVLNPTSVTRDL